MKEELLSLWKKYREYLDEDRTKSYQIERYENLRDFMEWISSGIVWTKED
jgi:hypothetical protein